MYYADATLKAGYWGELEKNPMKVKLNETNAADERRKVWEGRGVCFTQNDAFQYCAKRKEMRQIRKSTLKRTRKVTLYSYLTRMYR